MPSAANLAAEDLDGGGEDALDADAVAAHDGRDLFAVAVEDGGAHGLGVLVAELEDVADLDGFAEAQVAAPPMGSGLAFVDVADVGDEGGLEVARRGDVAEVVLLLVGAGDEVGAAFECLSRMTSVPGFFGCGAAVDADGTKVAGGRVEGRDDLFCASWGAARPRLRWRRAWSR